MDENNRSIKIKPWFQFDFFFSEDENNWLLKLLIFENFSGPEVCGSNLYQKNIGEKLTHWHTGLLAYAFIVLNLRRDSFRPCPL